MDVRNILRQVADLYRLNLIMPEDLKGRTSIKLRNVTWRQIFEVILEPLGYTYVDDRNIIRITRIADLASEPSVTRVFLINYAIAGELQTALLPLVDSGRGGRVQVDQRTNALLVTERPSRMNDIQAIIERLDRPPPQVLIEAKVFGVINREPESIDLDRETDNSESNINNIGRKGSAIYNPQDAEQILAKLETIKGARLVSSIQVMALDGEDATIEMIKLLPVPHYSFNEERGTFVVDGFEYQEIDIRLQVRPEVNSAGYIRLSITPKVSSRIGELSFNGQASRASLPVISAKTVSSVVMVKDGFTLLIGGLREEINHNMITPFVSESSQPQDGVQKDYEEIATENFMIFVTAKTLNPDGTTYQDTADPRVLHEMGIVDSEIPGYYIPDQQLKLLREIQDLRNESARIQSELEYKTTLSDRMNEKKENVDIPDE